STIIKCIVAISLLVFFTSTLACEHTKAARNLRADTESPPAQQLASLDRREPVPLIPMMALHQKENMRDHLVVIQEIVAALAAEDFDAVQRSASRISFSPQVAQMCAHMGAGAAGFTQMGIAFHATADTIIDAAKRKDLAGTLKALNATIGTCTTCHDRFRQEVVTEQRWQDLTDAPIPSHPH
ncbi:MAG: cytochrome c, partial [Nitrospirota bacterium]